MAGAFNASTGEHVYFGLGSSRMCCGPSVDTALQPCPPQSCPIKASGHGALPAAPFFAALTDDGVCECAAPTVCDAGRKAAAVEAV